MYNSIDGDLAVGDESVCDNANWDTEKSIDVRSGMKRSPLVFDLLGEDGELDEAAFDEEALGKEGLGSGDFICLIPLNLEARRREGEEAARLGEGGKNPES